MSGIHATYVDHMGSDLSVVNAARVSFDKDASLFSDEQNANLIRYLARGISSKEHKDLADQLAKGTGDVAKAKELLHSIKNQATHWTPFAHTAVSLRCSAPVPIRTQAFKHKQGLTENEESRRYISSRPEIYIPEFFRTKPTGSIKQGSGEAHIASDLWRQAYIRHCNEAVLMYENMIAQGVCPEQARFVLPQGAIVNWVWTGNIYAFANFYNKRTDPHAQKEIQELAHKIGDVISEIYPVSWAALTETE